MMKIETIGDGWFAVTLGNGKKLYLRSLAVAALYMIEPDNPFFSPITMDSNPDC